MVGTKVLIMTAQETEKLARLEQRVDDITKTVDSIQLVLADNSKDTKAIRSTLDNLTGGKQALMWFTGTIIAVAAVICGYLKLGR